MKNSEEIRDDTLPLRELKIWKMAFLLLFLLFVSNTAYSEEISCPKFGVMIGTMPIPVMAEASIESNCYRLFIAGDIGGGQVIAFDYSFPIYEKFSIGLGFGETRITRRAGLSPYQPEPLVSSVYSSFNAYGPTIRLDYRNSLQGSFYYSRFDIVGGLYGLFNGPVTYDQLDEVIDSTEKDRLKKELAPKHNNYIYPFGLMVSWGLFL